MDSKAGIPALENQQVEAGIQTSEDSRDPAITIDLDIHNHISQVETGKPTQQASPSQADRQTEPPDLSLYPNPKERMQALLKAMARAGFPIGKLLYHPFVWNWGRSQSGKTTLALMLTLVRLADGHSVSYFTTDDDYPREIQWKRVEDTPESYATGLSDTTKTINNASKGGLAGNSWVFDELLAAHGQCGIEITPLLRAVLMKGAKTKSGVIGISQADTSKAHGLQGLDAAWRDERVSCRAIHEEDELGNRYPTGRYDVDFGERVEQWSIPEWMLTELNKWGQPCPVTWMLNRFPELTRAGKVNQSSQIKNSHNNSQTEIIEALIDCRSGKGFLKPHEIRSSNRRLQELSSNTEAIKSVLTQMVHDGLAEVDEEGRFSVS